MSLLTLEPQEFGLIGEWGLEPNIVFLTLEQSPSFLYSIWKAGNLAAPAPFTTTRITSANTSNDYLADPELSPDGTQVVYSRVGHNLTPKRQSIRKVDWDDTTNTQIYFENGDQRSLSPTWHPNGSKILFRAKGPSITRQISIKSMNPDGTGVTTLYTSASSYLVVDPLYNSDGSKIAWLETDLFASQSYIKVMDADGSNVATIFGPAHPSNIAWANNSNTLAFIEISGGGTFTDPLLWRKINADGTGLTTLYSVNRSVGFGPGDGDAPPIKWSWLADDSAIVAYLIITPSDPAPRWILHLIDTDGTGITPISPERRIEGGTPDTRPVRIGTRIYFINTTFLVLASIKPDGSGYRVDFDGSLALGNNPAVRFHGFKGDTIND